jgi:hypothetical protein
MIERSALAWGSGSFHMDQNVSSLADTPKPLALNTREISTFLAVEHGSGVFVVIVFSSEGRLRKSP